MSKTSVIKIPSGTYTNSDVYERVLTYVVKKNYIGGYLLQFPFTRDSIINQFYSCEINSIHFVEPKIRHFVVSVSNIRSHNTLLLLAEQIASVFCPHYQVLYSLDLKTGHYHLHFAVNNYHFHPSGEPLSDFLFQQYLTQISDILYRHFPSHIVEIIQSTEDYHV